MRFLLFRPFGFLRRRRIWRRQARRIARRM
jgi:hypothetical protein